MTVLSNQAGTDIANQENVVTCATVSFYFICVCSLGDLNW